jgi:hypothetical protein
MGGSAMTNASRGGYLRSVLRGAAPVATSARIPSPRAGVGPADPHGSGAFADGSRRARQVEGLARDVETTWDDGGGAHSAASDVHTVEPPPDFSGPPEPLPPAAVFAAAVPAARSDRDEPARPQSRQAGGAAVDTSPLEGTVRDTGWQVPRPDVPPLTQPDPETKSPETPTRVAVPAPDSTARRAADGAAAANVAREPFSPAEPSGREAEPPEPTWTIVRERPSASDAIAEPTSAPRPQAVVPPAWPRLPRSVQFQTLPPLMQETPPPARSRLPQAVPTSSGTQAPVVAGGQARTDAHAAVPAGPPPQAKPQAWTAPQAAAPPMPTRRAEPATPAANRFPAPRHEESPRLTIHRLDVQIVNQPQPPGLATPPPAPAAPGPPDFWDTLDRHHLRNDGLLL